MTTVLHRFFFLQIDKTSTYYVFHVKRHVLVIEIVSGVLKTTLEFDTLIQGPKLIPSEKYKDSFLRDSTVDL